MSALHGVGLGLIYVLAFVIAILGLSSLRAGGAKRIGLASGGAWIMAVTGWLAAITGTFMLLPLYNARPPQGATDLSGFPRALLMSKPDTQALHAVGLIWKVNVGWFVPILATAVAVIIMTYGSELSERPAMRSVVTWLLVVALAAAVVSGVLGKMVANVAPLR